MTVQQIQAFDAAALNLKTMLDKAADTQKALDDAQAALETAKAALMGSTSGLQSALDAVNAAAVPLGLAVNQPVVETTTTTIDPNVGSTTPPPA